MAVLMRKLGLGVVALLLVLALLEAGLRLTAALTSATAATSHGESGRVILCVGDSWTMGAESGDPTTLSYPAQLQRLIDHRLGKNLYRVVKSSGFSTDATAIANELPALLHKHQPEVVIMLGGGINWASEIRPGAGTAGPGQGLWDRLKVVELLRVLLRGKRPVAGWQLQRQLKKARGDLVRVLATPEPAVAPALPNHGCSERALQTVAAVLAGLEAPGTPVLVQLRQDEPSCAAAAVLLAERCLKRYDLGCAMSQARAALRLAPDDPRALTVQLLAGEDDPTFEAKKTRAQLEENYSDFLCESLRRVMLTQFRREFEICHVFPFVEKMAHHYPACRAPKLMFARLTRLLPNFEGGQVLDQLDRLLQTNLLRIRATVQEQGSRLMLVNYPRVGWEHCRSRAIRVFSRFAREHGVPIVELDPLFNPDRNPHARQIFAVGHPNKAGYQAIARRVFQALLERGWIKPRS